MSDGDVYVWINNAFTDNYPRKLSCLSTIRLDLWYVQMIYILHIVLNFL